jgi:arylsulfatase
MEFAYAGGGLGKGGKVTLYVDGEKDGEGDVGATLAMIFSADDGCDVGKDGGSAVSPDYESGDNAFNGKVKGVQLSIAEDDGNTSSTRPTRSAWHSTTVTAAVSLEPGSSRR